MRKENVNDRDCRGCLPHRWYVAYTLHHIIAFCIITHAWHHMVICIGMYACMYVYIYEDMCLIWIHSHHNVWPNKPPDLDSRSRHRKAWSATSPGISWSPIWDGLWYSFSSHRLDYKPWDLGFTLLIPGGLWTTRRETYSYCIWIRREPPEPWLSLNMKVLKLTTEMRQTQKDWIETWVTWWRIVVESLYLSLRSIGPRLLWFRRLSWI